MCSFVKSSCSSNGTGSCSAQQELHEVIATYVFLMCVSADKWPVARVDKDQRKCKRNIFVLSCYKE